MGAFISQAAVRCVVLWELQQRPPHKHPATWTQSVMEVQFQLAETQTFLWRNIFLPVFSRIFSKCLEQSHHSLLTQTGSLFILVTDRQTDISTVEGKCFVYMVGISWTCGKKYAYVYFAPTSLSSTGNPVNIFACLCLPDLLADFWRMADLSLSLSFDNSRSSSPPEITATWEDSGWIDMHKMSKDI